MLYNNRGQIFTLIEILVVAAIIVTAGYFVTNSYLGGGIKSKPGEPATPVERAHGVDCANNLQQIRYAIQVSQTGEGGSDKLPATLREPADKQGLSNSMLKCPISGKDYGHDPAQGRVWCTTAGHEKY